LGTRDWGLTNLPLIDRLAERGERVVGISGHGVNYAGADIRPRSRAPDYYLPDNTGGVSVLISSIRTPPTPEPGRLIPLIGGAMFLVVRRRRSAGSN
jgi:hypothetical protein